MNIISLENISKWYGQFYVLKNCSINFRQGEVTVICGPSGSGKSTLIKCINGLEPIDEGRIIIDNTDLYHPDTNRSELRSRIGMVFQHFELFPHLKIIENLTLAPIKVLKKNPEEATEQALQFLDRVGLKNQADKHPFQLSGGQQQRVAIARALCMNPMVILFDEPTSALDPEVTNEVLEVIIELAQEGMSMIVVTHEMGFAKHVAHNVVFMDSGQILEYTEKETFFNHPQTERAQQFLDKILPH